MPGNKRKPPYVIYVIIAWRENILASARGIGVVDTQLTDVGFRRHVEAGEPLGFWSTTNDTERGEKRSDTQQLIDDYEKGWTVFLLFRERHADNINIGRTLGMARMDGKPGHPYTRPFPAWPRQQGTGTALGKWNAVVPFPVKWYFTSEMEDLDHGFSATLPVKFGLMDTRITGDMMRNLFWHCTNKDSILRAKEKFAVIPDHLEDFKRYAEIFNFGPEKPYAGKIKTRPYDKPIQ